MKRVPSDIFLEFGGSDLEKLTALAMHFRGAIRNAWLLPSMCVVHGPEAVRALQPVGLFRVVTDARLRGDAVEVVSGVTSAARLGVWGITIAADDAIAVKAAGDAARAAYTKGICEQPIKLIGSLDPLPASDAEWATARRTFDTFSSHVRLAALRCKEAGFYGIKLRASDAGLSAGLKTFARAQATPQPYVSRRGRDGKTLPTPLDLLDMGIHHPMLDPIRTGCTDFEMGASMLYQAIRRRSETPDWNPLLPSVWDEIQPRQMVPAIPDHELTDEHAIIFDADEDDTDEF